MRRRESWSGLAGRRQVRQARLGIAARQGRYRIATRVLARPGKTRQRQGKAGWVWRGDTAQRQGMAGLVILVKARRRDASRGRAGQARWRLASQAESKHGCVLGAAGLSCHGVARPVSAG